MDDLFRHLFERHPDAWAELELEDERIRVVHANSAYAAYFDTSVEALQQSDLGEHLPAEQYAVIQAALLSVAGSGVSSSFDVEQLAQSSGWVHVTISTVQVSADAAPRFIVQVRDEAARKRTERNLRRSEARLAIALESAELYSWSYELGSGRVDVDPRWAKHLGFTMEDFATSRQANDMVHPADRERIQKAFAEHFEGKTPRITATYRHITGAGAWRTIQIHAMLTERDVRGQPARVVGVSRDITEIQQLEQRVAVAERMASLGTLAAGVAHEINNPLTYLSANLVLVEESLTPQSIEQFKDPRSLDALRRMVADAREGTSRVVAIVRDLKALSRTDATPRRRVDLTWVVERSLELANHEISHRARVVRDFAHVPPVFANEGKLVQVVLNLLVNAAQAIREGNVESNSISVVLRQESTFVRLEVIDTGSGMTPDVVANAFDPFFTTKHSNGGTGLGLSICHSIVSELGGTIDVESTPGSGSTFRLRLPMARDEQNEAAKATPAQHQGRGLRILVVDDEESVARVLTRVLQGNEVVVETDAARALERIRAGEHFDRIFCDLMMPHMSGMDFFDVLVRLDEHLAKMVIFMTGGAFSARASEFLSTTSNPTIPKPFHPHEVRAIVAADPSGPVSSTRR